MLISGKQLLFGARENSNHIMQTSYLEEETSEKKVHRCLQKNTRIACLLWLILATVGIVIALSSSGTASSPSRISNLNEDKLLHEINILRAEVKRLESKVK